MRPNAGEFKLLASRCAGLSVIAACSAHRFPRHTHDEFGIGAISRGGQMSASGRGQVTAGAGDMITVNPGEVHDGEPLRGEPRAWCMFYLTPALMASLLQGFEFPGEFEFSTPVLRQGMAADAFRSAFNRLTAPDQSAPDLLADETLLGLFASLITKPQGKAADSPHPGLRRARALLDDDPTVNHSLKGLAIEAGLSRFQTLRAFVAWTGLTPHAYLMQQRASRARKLIIAGRPLAAAAFEAGYADQSHMTRDFRRRYGLTPSAFSNAR